MVFISKNLRRRLAPVQLRSHSLAVFVGLLLGYALHTREWQSQLRIVAGRRNPEYAPAADSISVEAKAFDTDLNAQDEPSPNEDISTLPLEALLLGSRQFSDVVLQQRAEELKDRYSKAKPFPHIGVDGYFPNNFLKAVSDEFNDDVRMQLDIACAKKSPGVQCTGVHAGDASRPEAQRKKSGTQEHDMMGPYTQMTFSILRSPPFVRFLERLTGIDGLFPDPGYSGSGLHMTRSSGMLQVHADFNFLKTHKMDRRVNVFVFLNEDWDEAWGGHLELWRRDMKSCEQRFAPIFNRLVVFTSTDFSYHGHPEPLASPENRTRRSIALYYYTNGRPRDSFDSSQKATHSTLFQRPLCRMAAVSDLLPFCSRNTSR
ncbi:hypothetical protein CYMTET_9061 [Cymbomonas tetramitiformis]|uniref:Prolyl 4-hydroxylase alpha subunit Fe(2+) 2OG dioxygenase domain-containing protein n=1 Tax=Cymbomonas tetramitiformis TaxID=36881 RepID=A0AAE0LFE5_9CHLO|nr:hypothetical protein CYMTET_9061 [Cymbomonas tetramitiformis]